MSQPARQMSVAVILRLVGARGGIPDQIVDGYNGFLVQPKDSGEIANKILWLIRNPEKARDMGLNGRRIVEAEFDINKNVDRVISIYAHLLPISPGNL